MRKIETRNFRRPGGDGPHAHSARRRRLLAGAAMIAALALPAAAHAATAPKATTGAAREVSYGAATLTGTINPAGSNTSYYFQYGPTKAYGSQTGIADAGSGSGGVNARLAIAGLQPITVYHYRLVAVNAGGVATGSDRSFKTDRVPLSLAILASPNPVAFGGTVTIQGTLSGTSNANRAVVLQANAFPFTAGFQSIGNTELTSATGGFSFTVPALSSITQFRVFTPTSAPVVSPVATENVAVRVSSHVARTKRHGFARIYGTVTPAVVGAQVGVLRIVGGRGVLAGGTVTKSKDASSSQFSRVVRVKKGAYRVLIKVAPGAVISAYGTPLLIR
ncbi:MAG TPA: hypothetical protein VHW67_13885 [Solirubrobacteraceae bacterium]|nr:hypothetical protein [Solirubrobacteraceae bacterium]